MGTARDRLPQGSAVPETAGAALQRWGWAAEAVVGVGRKWAEPDPEPGSEGKQGRQQTTTETWRAVKLGWVLIKGDTGRTQKINIRRQISMNFIS